MSSANYITARDLFLAHCWQRYVAFDAIRFHGFTCGRVIAKDGETFTVAGSLAGKSASEIASFEKYNVALRIWNPACLREPKAAESLPSVHEVISVGDWIGVDHDGSTVLFAPCAQRGVTTVEEGEVFHSRAKAWDGFLTGVRTFFHERGFVEVTTPSLALSPGTEPFLDPIKVSIEANGNKIEKYLITSPEFNLKKALAAGSPRVFEIAKCFRDREGGEHHRVEFQMLEWYRSFASLAEISKDVGELIEAFSSGTALKRISMQELFRQFLGADLEPRTTRDQLQDVAKLAGVRTVDSDDFNDIFHRIFLEKIEPQLERLNDGGPMLVSGFPPSMAALARIGAEGFADRFEVYWHGLELCNAFHELNDPSENRKRFEKDATAKQRSGRDVVPIDSELMSSFDLGIPPAGGIALGLERLFMAIHGFQDIAQVRPFLSQNPV